MGDKKYKQRHRELGLCIDCPDPVYPGRTRCLKHLRTNNVGSTAWQKRNSDYYLAYQRENKEQRRREGLCPMCGGPRDNLNKISCVNCREHLYRERYPIGTNITERT